MAERCIAHVRGPSYDRCKNAAQVGKDLCKTHDPEWKPNVYTKKRIDEIRRRNQEEGVYLSTIAQELGVSITRVSVLIKESENF